jgi:hypothetical protein
MPMVMRVKFQSEKGGHAFNSFCIKKLSNNSANGEARRNDCIGEWIDERIENCQEEKKKKKKSSFV